MGGKTTDDVAEVTALATAVVVAFEFSCWELLCIVVVKEPPDTDELRVDDR